MSDYVSIDFGRLVTVTEVEISLGPWTGDFPRDLEISAIDGETRTVVWRGSTAGMTLTAALASALSSCHRRPRGARGPDARVLQLLRRERDRPVK